VQKLATNFAKYQSCMIEKLYWAAESQAAAVDIAEFMKSRRRILAVGVRIAGVCLR
jgi:hypothetical protein